jgi:glutamine amidotransferase-like uncharacterized protein
MKKNFILISILFLSLLGTGCSKSDSSNGTTTPETQANPAPTSAIPDSSLTDPSNPIAQGTVLGTWPQILLFNGIGISTSDWQSLEQIIKSMGVTYQLVNSSALTAMSLTDMEQFKLILIPGGNSNTINSNLSLATRIRVKQAVRDGGVSYLGICAGAFAAVGIDTKSNTTAYYGFAVAQGSYLTEWYPQGNTSLIAAVPTIAFADGTHRSIIWYGGPFTPEWPGGVIARYPDGKPAISQTWTGMGFVIVSGPHPEAPPNWQYDSGPDPDGLDYDIAIKLIRATLDRKPLPTY